jgi:hypothetical protein
MKKHTTLAHAGAVGASGLNKSKISLCSAELILRLLTFQNVLVKQKSTSLFLHFCAVNVKGRTAAAICAFVFEITTYKLSITNLDPCCGLLSVK